MSKAKSKGKGSDEILAPNVNGSENNEQANELNESALNLNNEPKEQIKLDYSKSYKVISLISNKFLKMNVEYNVTGKLAEKMINNNQAKLKD